MQPRGMLSCCLRQLNKSDKEYSFRQRPRNRRTPTLRFERIADSCCPAARYFPASTVLGLSRIHISIRMKQTVPHGFVRAFRRAGCLRPYRDTGYFYLQFSPYFWMLDCVRVPGTEWSSRAFPLLLFPNKRQDDGISRERRHIELPFSQREKRKHLHARAAPVNLFAVA